MQTVERQRILEDEPDEMEGWFLATTNRLFDKWASRTGHCAGRKGWACEIYSRCRSGVDHMSLPCSLAWEGEEIGLYLKGPHPGENPMTFFRLFVMLLDEFAGGLEQISAKIGLGRLQSPNLLSVWCNKFAKHRLCIRVQHHPIHLFADAYHEAWPAYRSVLPAKHFIDGCGDRRPLTIIDYDWLADDRLALDLDLANNERQAVIVIPPFMEFLELTIGHYRTFVDRCLSQPALVKRFESEHKACGCF